MPVIPPGQIDSELNLAECIQHFDTEYIMDIVKNKIATVNYSNTLPDPNLITSLESDFKVFMEQIPDDEPNIKEIRDSLYLNIIHLLCDSFNLQFNEDDPSIDRYTAAFYLYDFLICNRVAYMINFFTSFIINNKDSLCQNLSFEEYKKGRDNAGFGKKIYADPKYTIIAANMKTVLHHIVGIDVTLYNIIESTYTNPAIVAFFDNIVTDRGDFCKDFYATIVTRPEYEPIINVGVRLALQRFVGDISQSDIHEMMMIANGGVMNA